MSLTCWTTLPRLRGSPHPQPRAPGVCGCLSPKRGVAGQSGSCVAGRGARKLEGAREPGRWGGGRLVTWANLPQGNEVSSRLLGGNWGRTDPPASDSSRERNIPSLAPAQPSSSSSSPRAARLEEPAHSGGSRPAPLPSPEAGVSFRAGFPAPTPRPRVQESPAVGRGRGGAGRMSPHGKRAGSQAQGQPRPPRSTLRAPDPLGCAPRVPGSLGAALPGRSLRAGGHPLAHPPGRPSAPTPRPGPHLG